MANEKTEKNEPEKKTEKMPSIPVDRLYLLQSCNHVVPGRGGEVSLKTSAPDDKKTQRYAIFYLPTVRHHRVEVRTFQGETETAYEEHMIHEAHVADWVPLR